MIASCIINRRSIRTFTPEPISNEQMQDILSAAFYAPTAKNKRDTHFTIVSDPELKRQLNAILNGPEGVQKYIEEAPVVIIPSCSQENREWAVENIAIATQNILLQAAEIALGGVWRNVEPDQELQVKSLFHIPESHTVVNVIPFGHPQIAMPAHATTEIDAARTHQNAW